MANLTIGISDLKVCRPPDVLVTYALGSCVGICLLDSVAGVGGLSHIMLPDSTQATNGAATPMRFADTAIPMLIREMVKLVMFATASERFNIGERNIQAVKAALRREGIPIVAEDTGLNYGRTVFFYPETGIMEIRAASMGNKQL